MKEPCTKDPPNENFRNYSLFFSNNELYKRLTPFVLWNAISKRILLPLNLMKRNFGESENCLLLFECPDSFSNADRSLEDARHILHTEIGLEQILL